MSELTDLEKRTLTIERTFSAPRKLVWEAWTQSEHIANWWAPPGIKLDIIKHDFCEGGDWEYTMKMENGTDFKTFGQYTKIQPEDLIETTANFLPMTEGVTLQAHFEDQGDKTGFLFKVIHPTEEYCKQQEEMGFMNGWGTVFSGLETYLGSL